ncbi:hypothetical protein Scep_019601 [Stephania cephalantha]|uniref:Uncharacterized protein n=1 Tax=Stephania cephalantha TaxID=152367 RepID=A0AAP0IBL9_9MAGN
MSYVIIPTVKRCLGLGIHQCRPLIIKKNEVFISCKYLLGVGQDILVYVPCVK